MPRKESHFRGTRNESTDSRHKRIRRGVLPPEVAFSVGLGRMSFNFVVHDDDLMDDLIPRNVIYLQSPSNPKGVPIDLTEMTEEELLAVKRFLDEAFTEALPLVRQLDTHAKENTDVNTRYMREYRQSPVEMDFRREKSEHDSSIPVGLELDAGVPPATD